MKAARSVPEATPVSVPQVSGDSPAFYAGVVGILTCAIFAIPVIVIGNRVRFLIKARPGATAQGASP